MSLIPKLIAKTKFVKRIKEYMKTEFSEVMHTTLNPRGPGAVRVHLVPPKFEENAFNPSVAIINGEDIIPVNFLWAVMLSELIKEINRYDGKEIPDGDFEGIIDAAARKSKEVIGFRSEKKIRSDIETIFNTLIDIAYRKKVTAEVNYMNIGEYADCMKAPHRMDVMVSAMVKDGHWHCNQKCVHCYAAGQVHSNEEELSTDEWKAVLDRCREAGIPQVTFTGGEPTMRDDLIELIGYSRWFISRLNTNGIKLTPEYCRALREAELDSAQITFYSSDPAVHNRLVGAEQHANTVAGIRNALDAGIPVSINTPLCTLNSDYMSTLRFLHEMGVVYVTCSGLITTGNALTEESTVLQLGSAELRRILKEASEYCAENGMELAFTSPGWVTPEFCELLGLKSPSCGACLSNMAITPSGNVVPCQSWLSEEPLGNMLTDEWETIWNSSAAESIRNHSALMTGTCPLRRECGV